MTEYSDVSFEILLTFNYDNICQVGGKTRVVVEENGLGRTAGGKNIDQTSVGAEDRMNEKMNERAMGEDISPPDSEDDF